MARALTRVERWICQNWSASSSATSSLIGFRISASSEAVCTRVYFSSEMKNSTSSTGIIWMLVPTVAWIHFSRGTAAGIHLLRELLQQALHAAGVGRVVAAAIGEALLDPVDGDLEPLALGGLEHVVDDALLEGLDRVLVVGGDENDLGAAPEPSAFRLRPFLVDRQLGDRPGGLDAVHAGHADVEEDQVGMVGLDQLDRLGAVLRFADDLEFGPHLAEAGAELLAQQPLVVGDHGGGRERRRLAHGAIVLVVDQ